SHLAPFAGASRQLVRDDSADPREGLTGRLGVLEERAVEDGDGRLDNGLHFRNLENKTWEMNRSLLPGATFTNPEQCPSGFSG
ncbi:hypothetical protein PMAYCL1PPCAC_04290, partial [Pristionchus mayeri]